MPFIHIRICGDDINAKQQQTLNIGMTDIMVNILGKKRELTAVQVETVPPQQWSIAGVQPQKATAYVEANITEGTNNAEQKAEAIQATYQMLDEVLGGITEASYIILREQAADSWGYAGLTMHTHRILREQQSQGRRHG